MTGAGNSKYVKRLNRMTILNVIKDVEPVSRQQLAQLTGLTPAAVTGIIRELIDMGLVQEIGLGQSNGGRRPVKLVINDNAGYVLGVEITSKETTFAIAGLKNAPEVVASMAIDMKEPDAGTRQLLEKIKEVLTSHTHGQKTFIGIGIAFPGQISADSNCIKRAVNLGLGWRGYPFQAILESELGIPVFLDTNSKVAALGEKWFGSGEQCDNLIYINLGEGISAGILHKEDILQGSQGFAGQIGHSVMVDNGPLCKCGNRGCLEAMCGVSALVRKALAEMPYIPDDDGLKRRYVLTSDIGLKDIIEVALLEDSYAREMLRQVGRFLGIVVANIMNFYNADEVFIGGKLAVAADVFIEEIRNSAASRAFPECAEGVKISVSTLRSHSGVVGACALTLKNLLRSPNSDMLELRGEYKAKQRKVCQARQSQSY